MTFPMAVPTPKVWPKLFIPILVVLAAGGVCGGLYRHETTQLDQRWKEREASRASILAKLLGQALTSIGDDLLTLADGDGLRVYLSSGADADLERAIRRAVFFSQHRPDFDQVRYLDERGLEILRINHDGAVVPRAQLQNKGDRPYFQNARSLAHGQISVSALDLNIENGQVEQPAKPVMRFSTPVFDANGQRRGVYVINALGAEMLKRLNQQIPVFQQRVRLLDANGYWLKAAQPEQEFGFMFPERANATLAKSDPTLWARIVREPAGQAPYHGGTLTWYRLAPREVVNSDGGTATQTENEFMVVASEMTAAEWADVFHDVDRTFLIVSGVLLLLLVPSVWVFKLRQQTVAELRRSQQMFQRLFENAPDTTLLVDRTGRIVRANARTETLFGYPRSELAGVNVTELLPERHRSEQDSPLGKYFGAPQSRSGGTGLELSARRKNGTEFPADITLSPLDTEEGLQSLAVIRDITERRRIEQMHLQFRALFESLPGLYLVLTPELKIVAVSNAYLSATMTQREKILGHSLFEIFPDNPREANADGTSNLRASLERVGRHLAPDTMTIQRYPVRRPDGTFEERYWSPVNSPVLSADHQLEYIVHRVEDVTDFIRQRESASPVEGGMRARMEQMEAAIFHSTQKISAANIQLQAANTELEAFSYSVSHDLRAPLRHIDGFSGLLQRHAGSALDDKGRHYLDTISDAARQMGRLIDDLLNFSRMGRTPINAVELDQDALVAEVIRTGRFDGGGTRVTWVVLPLPKVVADSAMLRQVWVNLLENAVKYSGKKSSPRIEIGHQPATEGHEAAFYVRDNGVGFDMKYANKLFGVFQRLHRAEDFPGTGVGLANVRRIVARHGGQTWAESQVGEGATFYFSLPKPAV